MSTLRLAGFADTHIGYRYADRANKRGINLRVLDGYQAFDEIVTGIIEEHKNNPIDGVLHGGDIFHVSHPSINDIMFVQRQLLRLRAAGIPFYGLAGNHDSSDNRSETAAVGVIDDPERNINALWKPYQKFYVTDDVVLHSVSHHGHHGDASVSVEAEEGKLNIFTTHGAALDPKNATLLRCMDSPREQIIPPELVLADEFDLRFLGHYHSRYAVGGRDLDTWYAGSTLRRGFSDEEGQRGWLLFSVSDNGEVTTESRNIFQRPQHDFNIIDASDLTPQEIQDIILENVSSTKDEGDTDTFDEREAPILRQRVINASRSTREGVDRSFLARQASHALRWQLEFLRPKPESSEEATKALNTDAPSLSKNKKSGSLNLEESYLAWAPYSDTLRHLSPEMRSMVGEEGKKHLNSIMNADSKEKEGH